MIRWSARRVSQIGQLDRTVADGNGVGSVADSHIDASYFQIRPEHFQAKHALGFDPGVEAGSRQENASIETAKALDGSRPFRLRRRPNAHASPFEEVDVTLCVRDRRLGIGPCEADFKRRKQNAIDDERLQILSPDPGVPQTFSSLERFNFEAVIIHRVTPGNSGAEGNTSRSKRM
jgi:hypothetical protein